MYTYTQWCSHVTYDRDLTTVVFTNIFSIKQPYEFVLKGFLACIKGFLSTNAMDEQRDVSDLHQMHLSTIICV